MSKMILAGKLLRMKALLNNLRINCVVRSSHKVTKKKKKLENNWYNYKT